jgi:hypothetical protein
VTARTVDTAAVNYEGKWEHTHSGDCIDEPTNTNFPHGKTTFSIDPKERLEDAMRGMHSIHVPHFQHFSARSALVSVHDKLSAHSIEIIMTLAILFGVLILLSFWAVVAR